jgi:hypothetical protein
MRMNIIELKLLSFQFFKKKKQMSMYKHIKNANDEKSLICELQIKAYASKVFSFWLEFFLSLHS